MEASSSKDDEGSSEAEEGESMSMRRRWIIIGETLKWILLLVGLLQADMMFWHQTNYDWACSWYWIPELEITFKDAWLLFWMFAFSSGLVSTSLLLIERRKRRKTDEEKARETHPMLGKRVGNPCVPIELCEAYRDTLKEEIKGIKTTIKTVGAVLGLLFALFEIVVILLK